MGNLPPPAHCRHASSQPAPLPRSLRVALLVLTCDPAASLLSPGNLYRWMTILAACLQVGINPLLVGLGQKVCSPQRPHCSDCLLSDLCPSAFKKAAASPAKSDGEVGQKFVTMADVQKLLSFALKVRNPVQSSGPRSCSKETIFYY